MIRDLGVKVVWQYVATLCTIVAELVTLTLLASYGTAEMVGVISFGYAFSFVVNQLFDIRTTEIIIKYYSETIRNRLPQENISLAWNWFGIEISLKLSALMAALIAVSIAYLLSILDLFGLEVVVASAIAMFFTTAMMAPTRGILRVLDRLDLQALVAFFSSIAKIGAVFFAVYMCDSTPKEVVWCIAAGSVAVPVICLATTSAALYQRFPTTKVWTFDVHAIAQTSKIREILSFARSQYFISLSMIPTKEFDIAVLSLFSDMESVGLYKVAKNVVGAICSIPDSIMLVIYPELMRYVIAKNYTKMWSFIRNLTVLLILASGIGFLTGMAIYPSVVTLAFGDDFSQSAFVFNILLMGLAVWIPFIWLNPLLLAVGRPDVCMVGSVIASVVMIATTFGLGYFFGMTGVAWANALASPIVVISIASIANRSHVLRALREPLHLS